MEDRVERLEDDMVELRAWTARHGEEHTASVKLLASIVDALREHSHNAHGVRSRAVQWGYTGLVVTIVGVIIEVFRRLVL